MSNVMRYRDEIQYNVKSVLCRIRDNGGMAPNKFLAAEQKRLEGKYAPVVMNVALMAMGKPQLAPLSVCWGLTENELGWLIEDAKKLNLVELSEIKELRAAREAAKQQTTQPVEAKIEPQPEPQEEVFATTYHESGQFFGMVLIGKDIQKSEGFASMDEARAWCGAQAPRIRFDTRSMLGTMHHARNRSDSDWDATLWR